jgi:predicted TIM-barrel fold metal-dependent hydrolase
MELTMAIDMHSHWIPPDLAEALRNRVSAPMIKANDSGREFLHQPRGAFPLPANYAKLSSRLDSMNHCGISCSVISLSSVFGVECLPAEESLPLARLLNDGISAAHLQHPEKFFGLATLPVADIDMAAREFERALRLPGMIGALIPGNAFLTLERAELFRPLFDVAQQNRAHILVHTGMLPNDTSFPPGDEVDNARERRITLDMQFRISSNMITLCLTGFLDSYPDVTVQCHNLGGNIPYEIDRLDHISLDRDPNKPPPSEVIRKSKVLVDCNSMGPYSIERAVDLYGAQRIVYGTDGSDFGATWTKEAIMKARISDEDKEAILTGNALRIINARQNILQKAAN